uniref:hypothetical protein n=1 Tax=Paractinoplanes polyasparticus TaxID=2856853 RepID=UPI001C860532|nr:hypothetical protein [Actinoplanes polyasparticus]
MERILPALLALAGVAVIVANKQFARSSARSSREIFGRDVGSREAAFQAVFTRVLAVVVGAALIVMGLLGAFGVIWND